MPVQMKTVNNIEARLGLDKDGRVQKYFTNACAKHMDKYVPMDSGNLADYYIESPDKIVYHQPYARYQYYGVRQDGSHKIDPNNRDRSKHPLATSYWDKVMWSAEKQDVIKETQKYFEHGGV